MKSLLVLVATLTAAIGASHHKSVQNECPAMINFEAEFPSIADAILPASEPFFFPTARSFFQDVMKFNKREIEQVTSDAITFFKTTFGVDFSKISVSKNGSRYLEEFDATLFDFQMNPAIGYSVVFNKWTVNGARHSNCVTTRGGGFIVMFGSDAILHGEYGGEEGRPIRANERIIYGFYNIPLCPQSPIVIQFQSATPIRIDTVDGFAIINLDLFNRELGRGLAQGVFRVSPLGDGTTHYVIRNLITFPPHPSRQNRSGSHRESCDNDEGTCTATIGTLSQGDD